MANPSNTEKGEAEVSNCVSNLIVAFTNGLDIFKRLRERRRKRKAKKHKNPSGEQALDAELQLSHSLRKGPLELRDSYERNYGRAGESFAKGDSIAHASLAETLIKLNTGLVGIIAAFLNHDSKSNRLDLDYKSLTSLSEASRVEAIDSMHQLYQRLSQSQLQVYRIGGCARCGSMKHQHCSGGVGTAQVKEKSDKRTHSGSRTRSNGHTIARIPIKSSSQPQLAVIRPRPKNHRKGSSSSASSTKSQSTALSSPYASPLGSPLPQYTPIDPFPMQAPPVPKVNQSIGGRRAGSMEGSRPTTWPHTRPDVNIPLQPPPPPPKLPIARKSPPPPREKPMSPPATSPTRRRTDKITPSTYTFASDSTKLGEIPQRNWTTPWNYGDAERLNAEALVTGYPTPIVDNKPKAKKGLFGFLRRGSAAN